VVPAEDPHGGLIDYPIVGLISNTVTPHLIGKYEGTKKIKKIRAEKSSSSKRGALYTIPYFTVKGIASQKISLYGVNCPSSAYP